MTVVKKRKPSVKPKQRSLTRVEKRSITEKRYRLANYIEDLMGKVNDPNDLDKLKRFKKKLVDLNIYF